MTEKIEANYEDLERISGVFGDSSEAVEGMINKIKTAYENLRDTWEGRGADAFFKEMEELVFPGLKKLDAAMDNASAVTKAVAQALQNAENEASGLFNQD